MKKYNYLSFFSGALGLDLGLEDAGMHCLAVNEFDATACKTIKMNKPDLKVYDGDIRELSAKSLIKDLKIKKGELFAIVGGPPCQAFSTMGKRLGLSDERGNVFLHFIDIIKGLQPKYVVIENVRGLLSCPMNAIEECDEKFILGSNFLEQKGSALYVIIKKLQEAGYSVSFQLYDASYFGVPQKRERVVMLCSRSKEEIPYLIPSHGNNKKKMVTVRESLKNIKAKEWINFNAKRLKFLKKLTSGQNWKNLSIEDQKEAMGNSYYSGGGKTGFFRRLNWDKQSPTLVTSPIMPATCLAHPSEDRPLSVEEYAAIQTFPKDYQFAGKTLDKYRQIGNAVPCLLGKAIGTHLINFHNKKLIEQNANITSRYNDTDHKSWLADFIKSIED